MKQFGYEYLQGTNLLHKLVKPNGMTLTQSYEAKRDLLSDMAYHRGTTLVVQREYTYDILGRPSARNNARQGAIVNDSFTNNTRSELVEAQANGKDYEYTYDNIGNRTSTLENSSDVASRSEYTTNALNQYTDIVGLEDEAVFTFTSAYDADGNQTTIKTSTGIWTVIYNAECRPVTFTNEESGIVVECTYDNEGRQASQKVTVNGSIARYHRYIYHGYLQIACIDLTRNQHPALWFITWDSTQPIATRPLSIQINSTWYTYGWDLTKNICELYSSSGFINTSYTYSPFGQVATSGNISQPIQWSSEFYNEILGMSRYNYRYYESKYSRWERRDAYALHPSYCYVNNSPICFFDFLGNEDHKLLFDRTPIEEFNSTNEHPEGTAGITVLGYYHNKKRLCPTKWRTT